MPAIVVEDGTGLTNSNSYQTEAQFNVYMAEIGQDISAFTSAQICAALIMVATDFMLYNYEFKGEVTFPDNPQALEFPRKDLCDRRGNEIPESGAGSIFSDLIKAQAQLALGQLRTGGKLVIDDDDNNQGAVIENKLDVLTQKYASPGTNPSSATFGSYQSYADSILAPYLKSGINPFQGTSEAVT